MSSVQALRGQTRRLPVRRARAEGLGLGAWAAAIPGALFWLIVAFTDGPAYYAMGRYGFTGHLLLILPTIFTFIFYTIIIRDMRLNNKALLTQFALLAAFLVYWLVQRVVVGEIREVAYFQTYAMIALLVATIDFYRQNALKLDKPFGRSITIVHYILCAYCAVSWIILKAGGPGIDWEYGRTTLGIIHDGSRGIRTSGFQREPAWAGLAISTTFLIAFKHNPQAFRPLIASFLAGLTATGSATAALFISVFAIHHVITARDGRQILRSIVIFVFVGLIGAFLSTRLGDLAGGDDASANMRIASLFVGADVIERTFPFGAGFGNYRKTAVFDPEIWGNMLNLRANAFYKSDVAWISITAELGLFGLAVLIWLTWRFAQSRSALVMALFAISTFGVGSLILPFLIPLAAQAGLGASTAPRRARELGTFNGPERALNRRSRLRGSRFRQ